MSAQRRAAAPNAIGLSNGPPIQGAAVDADDTSSDGDDGETVDEDPDDTDYEIDHDADMLVMVRINVSIVRPQSDNNTRSATSGCVFCVRRQCKKESKTGTRQVRTCHRDIAEATLHWTTPFWRTPLLSTANAAPVINYFKQLRNFAFGARALIAVSRDGYAWRSVQRTLRVMLPRHVRT